jgi:H+-transporting ATPase
MDMDPVPYSGLTSFQVEAARKDHGYNEVQSAPSRGWVRFFGRFWGISAWMLELIMLLSAAMKKYPDLAVVSTLLVVNAVVGSMLERRSAGVVEALRRQLRVSARALRDGSWTTVPARELVPGDLVRIRSGDVVAADLRLVAGALSLDVSSITGESGGSEAIVGAEVASGAVVRAGEGSGLVLRTGALTALGRTTELVRQARPVLHIEGVIAGVVRWLFLVVGFLIVALACLSSARGIPIMDVAPLALVLLLSAVPVALPVMFTVCLAEGSKELSRLGVLVTRLSAAEDAATMDVLFVDKTGTITLNELSVVDVSPAGAHTKAEVLSIGAAASQESNQDPIDKAFLDAAQGGMYGAEAALGRILSYVPFEANSRCTEALISWKERELHVMKGALKSVAGVCGFSRAAIEALEVQAAVNASKGCRTLAVAFGPVGAKPELLGLVAIRDLARPDAKPLVTALREMGVSVKVLTGDEVAVAAVIGAEVGLPAIGSIGDFKAALARSSQEATSFLAGVDGLAGVYPEDKFDMVGRLQVGGHVTGMTGDGVNDAAALRQAEVGIAVCGATDVAKGAASVVLNEPGLANIVELIRQGRMIYQRVLTWIVNKIGRTILKASYVVVAYAVTGRFAISALAMLLLTFMTDFQNISLATDTVRPSNKPESWNIGGLVWVSAGLGVAMAAEAMLLLGLGWQCFGLAAGTDTLQTFSFQLLFYFSVFSLVSVRERRHFWDSKPGKVLLLALGLDTVAATALTFVGLPGLSPLPWWQTLLIFAYTAIVCLGINDWLKFQMIRWSTSKS